MLAAIAIFVVGRWLVTLAVRLVSAGLTRQKVAPTVLPYVGSFISVTLNILLVVGILGCLGLKMIFSTVVDTPDNVHTVVGNNKIFADNIQNYRNNPYRPVSRMARLRTAWT